MGFQFSIRTFSAIRIVKGDVSEIVILRVVTQTEHDCHRVLLDFRNIPKRKVDFEVIVVNYIDFGATEYVSDCLKHSNHSKNLKENLILKKNYQTDLETTSIW